MNLHSSNESHGDSSGGGGGGEVIATTTITTSIASDEQQHEATPSSSSNRMNRNELAKYEIRMFVFLRFLRFVLLFFVMTRACSRINRYANKRTSY